MFRKMLVCSASVYMLSMNMNIIFSLSLTFRSVDTLLLSDRSVVLCKQTNNHPNHKTNKQKTENKTKQKAPKNLFFQKHSKKSRALTLWDIWVISSIFDLKQMQIRNLTSWVSFMSLAQFQVHHFAEICRLTFLCVGCCIHF